MSKVTQIVEIVRTGRGDLVSRTPWLVFAATSAARFYTVLVETADTERSANHPLNFLSACLCFYLYTNLQNVKKNCDKLVVKGILIPCTTFVRMAISQRNLKVKRSRIGQSALALVMRWMNQ